jgi:hypothetical protein
MADTETLSSRVAIMLNGRQVATGPLLEITATDAGFR